MRFEEYQKAANAVSSRLSAEFHAKTAVVLGSGLGGFADVLEDAVSVPFCEIPGAPAATNPAHKGELLVGTIRGVPVYLLSGRVHAYEGYSLAQTAFFVRVLFLLGVKNLILTCAAGGISPEYSPGDFVCISDHLYFFDDSPVRGEHLPEFGERFFDMTHAYDESARAAALETMTEMGISPKQGVYAYMPGPQYETPAEVRALSMLGADMVGMSTVAEAITAAQCGMKTLGIACISNLAAGISSGPLSDQEVTETAASRAKVFEELLCRVVTRL